VSYRLVTQRVVCVEKLKEQTAAEAETIAKSIHDWLRRLEVITGELTGNAGTSALLAALEEARTRAEKRRAVEAEQKSMLAMLDQLSELARLVHTHDIAMAANQFVLAARVVSDMQAVAAKLPNSVEVCERARADVAQRRDALTARLDDMFARMFAGGTLSDRWLVETCVPVRAQSAPPTIDSVTLLDALAASAGDALERRGADLGRRLIKQCVPRLLNAGVEVHVNANAIEFRASTMSGDLTAVLTRVYANIEHFVRFCVDAMRGESARRVCDAALAVVLPALIGGVIEQHLQRAGASTRLRSRAC
jgi:hypothetical protein